MRVKIVLVMIAIVTFLLPFVGLRAQSQLETVQTITRFASLDTHTVENNEVKSTVEALGKIQATNTNDLSFDTSGEIVEVFVTENQYVRAGDVIAVIDNTDEVLAYQRAALELNRAELALFDIQKIDDDALTIAEANVLSAWSSYNYSLGRVTDEDISAAEVEYQNALAFAEFTANEASRAPGGYGSQNHQELTADAGEASFNAEIARLQIERLKAQQNANANGSWGGVITAQAELDLLLAGPTADEITLAEIDVQMAQLEVDRTYQDYVDTHLVAPYDGYISSMNLEAGTTVSNTELVAEIIDISSFELTIEIDEVDLGLLDVGMPIDVSLDAMSGLVLDAELGTISSESMTVDGVVVYEADVILNEITPEMRVGMTAEANIITNSRADVLSVPNGFLREDRASNTAFVNILRDDGTLQEIEVELGLRGIEYSEVIGGIDQGMQIAINNSSGFQGPPILGGGQ